jgi:2,5-furandicarboxylate decarboxylase 1
MAFRDHLAAATVVKEPISVVHGLWRWSAANDGAMAVFERLEEAPGHRAAINMLTRERLCAAIGIAPEAYIDTLGWAMANPTSPALVDMDSAEAFEVRRPSPSLSTLPIPHHWPEDAGRYMSASVIVADDGERRNISFHRQLLKDDEHVVVRLVPRHLRTMVDEARAAGREVNIAIVNAPDPVVLLAAASTFAEFLDEMTVAAALHERLYGRTMRCTTAPNGVVVPADAEYVMWGRITLDDADEGPYVDITGTVDDVRQQPVIAIDGVAHRTDPIFHALIPGEAEHKTLMGLPRAPTIKAAVNEVVTCHDVHMTDGGCGWLACVVRIQRTTEDDPRLAIEAAFRGHPSMKAVTVVDEDIDITDPRSVEWAMMTRWQPDRDTIILRDQRGSSLDPSRYDDGRTSKVGFDATVPWGADRAAFTTVQSPR